MLLENECLEAFFCTNNCWKTYMLLQISDETMYPSLSSPVCIHPSTHTVYMQHSMFLFVCLFIHLSFCWQQWKNIKNEKKIQKCKKVYLNALQMCLFACLFRQHFLKGQCVNIVAWPSALGYLFGTETRLKMGCPYREHNVLGSSGDVCYGHHPVTSPSPLTHRSVCQLWLYFLLETCGLKCDWQPWNSTPHANV